MDISLKFRLFASDRVRAILNTVSVDVSWTILEHLASLGCTGVVQAALEKQAEVFLKNLMGASMAAQLAGAVQSDVNARLTNLNASHPPHPFRRHSMEVSEVGI